MSSSNTLWHDIFSNDKPWFEGALRLQLVVAIAVWSLPYILSPLCALFLTVVPHGGGGRGEPTRQTFIESE